MRVIVVGIDGSDVSKEAFRFALHEAGLRGSRVRAVHAWSPVPPVALPGPGVVPDVDQELIRSAAERVLRSAVDEVAGGDTSLVDNVLVEGSAGEALTEQGRGAELIVLGSHGHTALAELLLGSVSRHVLRHAPCPVVIVPGRRDD
jgi:nucleotide-binding universal stress UspA family protein